MIAAPAPRLTKARLYRLAALLSQVSAGLLGMPFEWTDKQRQTWAPLLRAIGVELVPRSGIERRRHRLLRGAKPVGRSSYAPTKTSAPRVVTELFVLHVQTSALAAKPARTRLPRPKQLVFAHVQAGAPA
jgi:hypothetical protein